MIAFHSAESIYIYIYIFIYIIIYVYACVMYALYMYLRKLCHSEGLSQFMGVVRNIIITECWTPQSNHGDTFFIHISCLF